MEMINIMHKRVQIILFILIYKMNILLKVLNFVFFFMIIVFILMNVGFQKTIKVGMNYSVILMQNVMMQLL